MQHSLVKIVDSEREGGGLKLRHVINYQSEFMTGVHFSLDVLPS